MQIYKSRGKETKKQVSFGFFSLYAADKNPLLICLFWLIIYVFICCIKNIFVLICRKRVKLVN